MNRIDLLGSCLKSDFTFLFLGTWTVQIPLSLPQRTTSCPLWRLSALVFQVSIFYIQQNVIQSHVLLHITNLLECYFLVNRISVLRNEGGLE